MGIWPTNGHHLMALYGYFSRQWLRPRPPSASGSRSPAFNSTTVSRIFCFGRMSSRLMLDRDRLQFKMPAAQDSRSANKLARRELLREVGFVDGVELVEERQVRAGNLYINQIVHRHPGLRQNVFLAVKQQLYLVLNFLRRLSILVEPDSARQVESVSRQNRIAEWSGNSLTGQVDRFARGLRRGMRIGQQHAKKPRQ